MYEVPGVVGFIETESQSVVAGAEGEVGRELLMGIKFVLQDGKSSDY